MSKFINVKILRYDPDKDKAPHFQTYKVELRRPGMLLLTVLNQIKWELDPTLSFRRSCREGVCGSDGMNVNGVNMLSCMTKVEDLGSDITIKPLPGMPVIRDLVVDISSFINKFITVKPYIIRHSPMPDGELYQSAEDRKKLDGLYECILCGCCSSSCPSYWVDKDYLGPNAFLRAWRYLIDSRDFSKTGSPMPAGMPFAIHSTTPPQGLPHSYLPLCPTHFHNIHKEYLAY